MQVKKQKIIWSSAGLLAALMLLASCGDNTVIPPTPTVSVQATSSTVATATVTSVPSKLAANATAQVATTKSPQTASSINTPATSTTAKPSLETISDIALPGDTSRFDYQSLDPQTNLLFIAHLGASTVLVFDTNQDCGDHCRNSISARGIGGARIGAGLCLGDR